MLFLLPLNLSDVTIFSLDTQLVAASGGHALRPRISKYMACVGNRFALKPLSGFCLFSSLITVVEDSF